MIISGHALLALLSSPQESQTTREEGGFGALLTEIEQHPTSLPDQEEAERRALESVLQVLMSMFQSCTPAHGLPAASAPGIGESEPVSIRPAAGLPLGLPSVAFPALDGQGTGTSAATVGAPENFSWFLHRQESMQGLSGLFMAQPTAGLETPPSAASPAALVSFSSDSVLATAAPANRVFPHIVFATLGQGDGLTSEMVLQAQRHLGPSPEGSYLLPTPATATAEMQQPGAFRASEITPMPPLVGPGLTAQSLAAGEEVFQSTHTTLPPIPGHAVPTAPWAMQATASLTEATVPFPTVPQTEVTAASAALWPGAFAPEDAALPAYEAAPTFRPLPRSQGRAAATVPGVASFATDSGLSLGSPRATSHTPSAEPASTVPPSHALEDLARPWPRPLPANTMVLHLEPRELGTLLLQVRINDKRLIASFQAQSPEAETLLRAHLPSLHESLSQHGFEVQPIAISLTAEGFNAHMGAGTGAFAHQHSAFQAFAQDQQAASAREVQSEVDLHRTPRRPSEQRPRLLDVVI